MSKYSNKLKIKVVEAYLNNEGGYRHLAKKYKISDPTIVKRWVHAFKSRGYEGITTSRKNNNYSFEFKQNIVKLYLSGEMSYQELANQFKMNNPSLITRWVNDVRKQGLDGIRPRKRGRPSSMVKNKKISKKTIEKAYSEEEIDEIKKLKEELYWTQMELDFLKKKMELEDEEDQRMKKYLE